MSSWKLAGAAANVDIRTLRTRFTGKKVAVTTRYTNLRKNDDEVELRVDIKTARGSWTVSAQVNPISPDGFFVLARMRSERVVDCAVSGDVAYRRDLLKVTIPNKCLESPRWVRFRGFSQVYNEDAGILVDDAMSRRAQSSRWSARIHR